MNRIHKHLIILISLVFIACTSSAAQDDLGGLIEFRDEHAHSSSYSKKFNIKPWREQEKQKVIIYFQVIRKEAPGLLRRATAYRPIRLYRATDLNNRRAVAVSENNSLTFSDAYARDLAGKDYSVRAAGTLAHELTHLADSLGKLALSKQWIDLVRPRIERVQEIFLKKRGMTVKRWTAVEKYSSESQENKRDTIFLNKIATQQGLPNGYAVWSFKEALAVYAEWIAMNESYSPPETINEFIRSELLSIPFVPEPSVRHAHQGLTAQEKGLPNDAIRAFDEAVKIEPDIILAYVFRGKAWQTKNELDRAIADYSHAIRLSSDIGVDVIEAYAFRGGVYVEKGEADKAIADYSAYIEMDDFSFESYYRRGYQWLKKKDYDKAISDFSDAIKRNPSYIDVYYHRGTVWRKKNDLGKAIADYTEAIRLNPKYEAAYNGRAELWFIKKDFDRAIADFGELIKIRPDTALNYFKRGAAWYEKSDFDKAIADYTEAIRLYPKYPTAYYMRGIAWYKKNNHVEAIADFSEAIKINPGYVQAYQYRGALWLAKKDFDRAISDFSEAIKTKPDEAGNYYNRGHAWVSKNDCGKAIDDFNQAIRLSPKLDQAYNSLAFTLATCQDPSFRNSSRAVETATGANELTGWKNPHYISTLAAAYAEAGDFKKAVEWITKALEMAPEQSKADFQYELQLYQTGKPYREKK